MWALSACACLPGFHVPNDMQIVLVPADSALDLMKQVPQLHEDDQAGHG